MNTHHRFDGFFTEPLASRDPELQAAITGELTRQRDEIELIASENIVSAAVMEAQGSVLTNKYAEGYPGRRYYGGCHYVDVAENLAIDRARQLFSCEFANVQPNSGSQANQGVFQALLQPGDTILGMNLASGGHLTHGAAPNQSGKWFNAVQYGVRREDHRIDYAEIEALAKEHNPKLIIAGGSAIPRIIDFARMRAIADTVGAYLLVDMAHFAGLVAAGEHPSPFPHAHVATTTTHKTLRGPRGGMILTNDEAIAKGSVSEVYAWAADCCGEAGPRRCPPDHADEMEPSQIAVQVLRGDAAIAAQETLQLAVAAIDRLNVEGIPDPLSGRKVQGFVANAHGRSAGRIAAMTVRNQNDVGIQNRFEHRLQGLGVDRRKNLADGCAAAIGGDQDRHLFIRQAALAGLAATLARLAIQSARSLVALKHVSLVNFDNALEFRPILACGLQETVPPAEGRIDAKSASTGRFPYRLALGQRHAE